jgi:hypothetical protein
MASTWVPSFPLVDPDRCSNGQLIQHFWKLAHHLGHGRLSRDRYLARQHEVVADVEALLRLGQHHLPGASFGSAQIHQDVTGAPGFPLGPPHLGNHRFPLGWRIMGAIDAHAVHPAVQ